MTFAWWPFLFSFLFRYLCLKEIASGSNLRLHSNLKFVERFISDPYGGGPGVTGHGDYSLCSLQIVCQRLTDCSISSNMSQLQGDFISPEVHVSEGIEAHVRGGGGGGGGGGVCVGGG